MERRAQQLHPGRCGARSSRSRPLRLRDRERLRCAGPAASRGQLADPQEMRRQLAQALTASSSDSWSGRLPVAGLLRDAVHARGLAVGLQKMTAAPVSGDGRLARVGSPGGALYYGAPRALGLPPRSGGAGRRVILVTTTSFTRAEVGIPDFTCLGTVSRRDALGGRPLHGREPRRIRRPAGRRPSLRSVAAVTVSA